MNGERFHRQSTPTPTNTHHLACDTSALTKTSGGSISRPAPCSQDILAMDTHPPSLTHTTVDTYGIF